MNHTGMISIAGLMRSAPRLESREVKGSGWWTCESCKDSWLVPQFMASHELRTPAGSAHLPTKCQFHPVLLHRSRADRSFAGIDLKLEEHSCQSQKHGRNGKLGIPYSWFAYCKFGRLPPSVPSFVLLFVVAGTCSKMSCAATIYSWLPMTGQAEACLW